MARTKYWVWLSSFNIGSAVKRRLLDTLGDPERIFFADRDELSAARLSERELSLLSDKSMERTARILADCERQNISVFTLQDADYPERLRQIPDPPAVLYVRGKLPPVDDMACIAVVGTRKTTPYGARMARLLGSQLAAEGGVVVSGFAAGVDSGAMEGALCAGGTVIGVLGTAVDEVYPRSSRELFDQCAVTGAILSEYPPRMRTMPWNFKERNRILSGLSLGVVVVEAPARSGSLVTAGHALEQNRDVFAVPGNADAVACAGTNRLLRQGAVPVTSGSDVMEHYRTDFAPTAAKERPIQLKKEIDKGQDLLYIDLVEKIRELDEPQRSVALAITEPDMLPDDITAKTGLPAQRVMAALTLLEIAGIVRQENRRYSLAHLAQRKG